MKKLTRILMVAALFAIFAPALAIAQQPSPTPAAGGQQQESNDDAKRRLYTTYYENYANNPAVAYRAAQEYVQRFGSDNDEYVTALRAFITTYETGREVEADNAVYNAINQRRYPEAFRLGRERLTARPDNLKMVINLAWAGLQATIQGTNPPADLTAQAIGYANQALQAIQAGRTPAGEGAAAWAPFTNRDDTIGWLNYALGTMNLRTNPTEAAAFLRRAAETNGAAKREPTTYSYLAYVYNTEYERLRTDYQTRFPAGSTETDESRAALTALSSVIDRIMDAYARAINASNAQQNPAQYATQRAEWTTALTALWRFRNNDSEQGLQAFISGAATRPLIQPGQPAMTMPNQRPATTTTGSTPPSNTNQPSTTTSTPAPNTTAPTTRPSTTTTPANTTTRPATTTRPSTTTRPTTTTRPSTTGTRRPTRRP
jgi:hypothetical protein